MTFDNHSVVAVIGLGYVGLPLAVEFGKKLPTIGYDLSEKKIAAYKSFIDTTREVSTEDLKAANKLQFTSDPSLIASADFIVIAVPTPVTKELKPDFEPLISASKIVGQHMKSGAVVIYESTVYPGATEEICVPILEEYSKMIWQKDFNVGYSPERVNPADKERTITKITKVVSADNSNTLNDVADLYESIIDAGVYRASSIKVAEAAKVIENTQRDLNIALMNELAIIFHKMNIDTLEVLEAAGTKWNFLPFRPGLVGGHCIGVDPYYLTYKSKSLGYDPKVILAGRSINDSIADYLVEQVIQIGKAAKLNMQEINITVLGITFKENCPDVRNSKVVDIIKKLQNFGCKVFVHDPIAAQDDVREEYQLEITSWENLPVSEVLIAAVAHKNYLEMPINNILEKLNPNGLFMDIKSTYSSKKIISSGFLLWRL